MSTTRMTRQRAAVIDALDSSGFRSAQGWHDLLRSGGDSVGLATVYRTLQSLADEGSVDTVVTESGETLYRRCETPDSHHHHLRCRVCGAATEIELPQFENWARAVAEQHGYTQVGHTFEVTGICPECRAQGRS